MKAADQSKPWSRRKWLTAVLLVFGLQAGLIWFYADRSAVRLPPDLFRTDVQWLTKGDLGHPWEVWPWLQAPAVVPMPNHRGFSGAAWLRLKPLGYNTGGWTNGSDWLTLDSKQLGHVLHQAVAQEIVPPFHIADQPFPPLPSDRVTVPNRLPPTESRLQIKGPLAERKLLSPLPLPSWSHTMILTNTVLQVAVQADGTIFSAVLLRSSGLPMADAYALRQVEAARFKPVTPPPLDVEDTPEPAPLTFGILDFFWHTQPSPSAAEAAQTGT